MTYEQHEAKVIAGAKEFIASDFKGRATYAKEPRPTREGAIMAAREMIARRDPADPTSKGRPVLVYAWDGVNQVVSDTVRP